MPINVPKLIHYWKQGAEEELDTAHVLLENRKKRETLFFAHLALEKALKAHVVRATSKIAPYSHDLPFLAHGASLELSLEQRDFLAEMNKHVSKSRYPGEGYEPPSLKVVREYLQRTEEMVQWLIQML
jgi:HEPN domain-containing protein